MSGGARHGLGVPVGLLGAVLICFAGSKGLNDMMREAQVFYLLVAVVLLVSAVMLSRWWFTEAVPGSAPVPAPGLSAGPARPATPAFDPWGPAAVPEEPLMPSRPWSLPGPAGSFSGGVASAELSPCRVTLRIGHDTGE